jgi:hypothetical protein
MNKKIYLVGVSSDMGTIGDPFHNSSDGIGFDNHRNGGRRNKSDSGLRGW